MAPVERARPGVPGSVERPTGSSLPARSFWFGAHHPSFPVPVPEFPAQWMVAGCCCWCPAGGGGSCSCPCLRACTACMPAHPPANQVSPLTYLLLSVSAQHLVVRVSRPWRSLLGQVLASTQPFSLFYYPLCIDCVDDSFFLHIPVLVSPPPKRRIRYPSGWNRAHSDHCFFFPFPLCLPFPLLSSSPSFSLLTLPTPTPSPLPLDTSGPHRPPPVPTARSSRISPSPLLLPRAPSPVSVTTLTSSTRRPPPCPFHPSSLISRFLSGLRSGLAAAAVVHEVTPSCTP